MMKTKIKAVLIDFDGTLVTEDMLDIICELVAKKSESKKLNSLFKNGKLNGRASLIARINLLKGVSLPQIEAKLHENNYLRKDAQQFIDFLHKNNIISVLYSGNIAPILKYYQRLLNIDYIVDTTPKIKNNVIAGISEEDFPKGNFKIEGIKQILNKLNITPNQTLAIGDSHADIPIFKFAGYSLAINAPKEVEKQADRGICRLDEAVSIIKN